MKKFGLGILVASLFVFGLAVDSSAYVSLFGSSFAPVDNDNGTLGVFNNTYFGYGYNGIGDSWSGYYLGTFSGNESESDLETLAAHYLGVSTFDGNYAKVDGASGSSSFLTTTANPGNQSGTWATDPFDLGFYAVKAGNDFSLYFVDPPASTGDWTTAHLVVGSGQTPAISHLSALATTAVPEPSTLLLLGSSLLGLGYAARKFKKN